MIEEDLTPDDFEEEPPAAEEDAASEEGGEREYLLELERVDRLIETEESEKAACLKVFNKHLKDLRKQRAETLKDIEAFRLGERGLFDE